MLIGRFVYNFYNAVRQSKGIAINGQKGFASRCKITLDMMRCYHRYKMFTDEYLKERMYEKNEKEKQIIGLLYKEPGEKREKWMVDFEKTRKFLSKYSSIKYEKGALRVVRRKAYMAHFHTGKELIVEYDVNISRQHGLDGELKIGKHVLLAKHSTLDYSGGLQIGDDVQITDGVHILTHDHVHHHQQGTSANTPNNDVKAPLVIGDGAVLGTRCIIMPSCNYIGKQTRIGAGAVVTHDIPDYAIAVGVPAKVIGTVPKP